MDLVGEGWGQINDFHVVVTAICVFVVFSLSRLNIYAKGVFL